MLLDDNILRFVIFSLFAFLQVCSTFWVGNPHTHTTVVVRFDDNHCTSFDFKCFYFYSHPAVYLVQSCVVIINVKCYVRLIMCL